MDESAVLKRFSVALDLRSPMNARPFEVVEGDTGNVIEAELFDGGEALSLDGCYIAAVFSSPKGTAMQDSTDGSVTVDGSKVTIELYPGSYAPGVVECELQIYSSSTGDAQETSDLDVLVTTARFNFKCRSAMFGESTFESSAQYPFLSRLLSGVELAEAGREAAEAERVSNETARQTAEAARQTAETARQTAETARQSAETARQSAETARASAESARATAESGRATMEFGRKTAENERVLAEAGRVLAEQARAAAETARVAAEEEREAALLDYFDSNGYGVLINYGTPTPTSPGDLGRPVLDVTSGKAYICTSITGGLKKWTKLTYDTPWEQIKTFAIASDSGGFSIDVDSNGDPFEYDELRLVMIGGMKSIMGVNIFLNGSQKYIRDNNFMNKECADVSENMTVLHVKRMEKGFVITERQNGGITEVGGYSTTKGVQTGFLKLGTNAKYSSIEVLVISTNGKIAGGTQITLEGRDLV